jgi:hypothetical protein
MDLALLIHAFGIALTAQDESPASDFSSYESMRRTWRSPDPIPTQQELEAAWTQILPQ